MADVAGAATKIEREIVRADRGQLEQPPFPESVETEALQVINEIVPGSDRAKELINPSGPPLAGDIKAVCHALGSLAKERVLGNTGCPSRKF